MGAERHEFRVPSTGGWEEWQKEYRFGVLLIYPPEPTLSRVNALREQHDPRSQSYCDAHISLTVPAPSPVSEESWAELESVASAIEPVHIRYGPIRVYPPHPGVTLAVEPQQELRHLCGKLESVTPFSEAPERRWPFSAHMTIAEFLSWDQTEQLAAELASQGLAGEFTCSFVSLAIPDETFHFTERRRLFLGGREG